MLWSGVLYLIEGRLVPSSGHGVTNRLMLLRSIPKATFHSF